VVFDAKSICDFSFRLRNKYDLILSSDEMAELEDLCGFKIRDKRLIYKAIYDGFTANAFHSKCDQAPSTLVIIQSEHGNVFGGFTKQSWQSYGGFKRDENAFIFSFKNKLNEPEKMMVNPDRDAFAIVASPNFGPVFGHGSEIIIKGAEKNKFICTSKFGENYVSRR
jgi:hypothetical protein